MVYEKGMGNEEATQLIAIRSFNERLMDLATHPKCPQMEVSEYEEWQRTCRIPDSAQGLTHVREAVAAAWQDAGWPADASGLRNFATAIGAQWLL